jgi:multidrug efflux pump subunit AcrA (membrane-fusion protein)
MSTTVTALNRVVADFPSPDHASWSRIDAAQLAAQLVDGGSTGEQPPRRSWGKRLVLVATTVVMVAALVVAYKSSESATSHDGFAADAATDALKVVNVDRPTPSTMASIVLPATIRPWQTATLHARASGYLSAWHKDLGAAVQAGEVLAELETPELDQEVSEGVALAREATAAVAQAKAERVEAEADLQVAEAQLVKVNSEVELTKLQLGRREQLLAKRAISQEEYEVFRRDLEVRAADVTSAAADVARRRTNLETRAAIIEVREATANSRQANVDRLKELQRFKRIVAPFNGIVTHRSAEIGMLVTAGKEPLFVVEDMNRVRVQVNVPQTYAMQVAAGAAATVSVPESAMPAVPGTITRFAQSVVSSSRSMLAEIELENTTHHFQPGSYAQVALTTQQRNSAWSIPASAVSMRVEGPHVVVVNDHNQIEIKPVSLGRDMGPRIVVTEGIAGDERLVLNPGDDLVSGTRIQIGHGGQTTDSVAQR